MVKICFEMLELLGLNSIPLGSRTEKFRGKSGHFAALMCRHHSLRVRLRKARKKITNLKPVVISIHIFVNKIHIVNLQSADLLNLSQLSLSICLIIYYLKICTQQRYHKVVCTDKQATFITTATTSCYYYHYSISTTLTMSAATVGATDPEAYN